MNKKNELYVMREIDYFNGLRDFIQYVKDNTTNENLTMIEIGAYAGESTTLFANHFSEVITIDPYLNDYDPNDVTIEYMDLDKVYDKFIENTKPYPNIKHIKKTSDDAIQDLKNISVDVVYIDGLHTYNQIKKDIENYLPLVKKNGFIGGHDYHQNWYGVVSGINEKLGVPEKIFADTSWIFKVK
jgi:Methyltransferase domain